MRPGPGLVVMALAFISGARRGSTSTSTSSNILATSYSTSSTATTTTAATPATLTQSTLVAIVTPLPTTTTTTTTSTKTTTTTTQPISHNFQVPQFVPTSFLEQYLTKAVKRRDNSIGGSGVGGGSGGGLSRIRRKLRKRRRKAIDFEEFKFHHRKQQQPEQQQQSDIFQLPLFELPTHSQRFYEQAKTTKRSRRSRSLIEQQNLSGADVSEVEIEESTGSSDQIDTESNNFGEGLTVRYTHPSDSSNSVNSFDEEDILGLVEERSLISEESYDRLAKLAQNKISYANEEDYSEGVDSDSSTRRQKVLGSESSYSELSETTEEKLESVRKFAIITESQLLAGKEHEPEKYYAANLVSNNPIATLSWSLVEENNDKKQTANDQNNLILPKKGIIESASPLTRLNPWISACDLAQPGTAPDLQVNIQKYIQSNLDNSVPR